MPRAGLLLEGVDAGFSVVPLRGHGGNVGPVEEAQDLSHGLGLVEVGRHRAGEEVVAGLVAELRAGGGVADLRDLEEPQEVGHLQGQRSEVRGHGVMVTLSPKEENGQNFFFGVKMTHI